MAPGVRAQKESSIQASCNEAVLLELGVIALKTKARGWPDYLYLIPGGRPLFIEWKRRGLEPRGNQKITLFKLYNLHYDIAVCDSKEQGIDTIRRACQKARKRRTPSNQDLQELLYGDWRKVVGLAHG